LPVPRLRIVVPAIVLIVAACAPAPSPPVSAVPVTSSAPALATPTSSRTPSASIAAAPSPRQLVAGSEPLAPGSYTNTGFRPPVTFAVKEGWFVGTVSNGFFDVQQDRGTPDVVAVQFARVEGVIGAAGAITPASSTAAAVRAIHENPGLVVVDESASRLGGFEGLNVIVENRGASTAPVMQVPAGRLAIDPRRRLWISLFDTADGLLAVMVGGSVAEWEHALGVAEPVLESVVIGR
jgi:hypothetical protein